jgi:hypothetical protein
MSLDIPMPLPLLTVVIQQFLLLLAGLLVSTDNVAAIDCEFYLAESTIPNAGLGIFTAIERLPGDDIGEGDVCIPIIDAELHQLETLFFPFQEYVWAGEVM